MCEKKSNNSYLVLFLKNLIFHRWGKCFPKERIEKSRPLLIVALKIL